MFCPKCKMIFSYDSYNDLKTEDNQKMSNLENEICNLKEGYEQNILTYPAKSRFG